jgi:transmembrane sensor
LGRYIEGTCTRQEAEAVLAYIQTEEGRQELQRHMFMLEASPEAHEPLSRSLSERMLASIRRRTTPRTALFPPRLWRAAASVIIVLGFGYLGYTYRRDLSAALFPIQYTDVVMPAGYTGKVTLADGTVVTLNGGARIRYPKHLVEQSTRAVFLQGEAFFKVASNPEKPFVITTHKAEIRVLGTAFNVREAADSSTTVAVTEGVVSFKRITGGILPLTLKAGDVGTLQGHALSRVHLQNTSNYMSWETGRLTFDQVKLSEVARQLQDLYGLTIELQDAALADMLLTADMRRGAAPYVIREIATYLHLEYAITGNTVRFYRPKQ